MLDIKSDVRDINTYDYLLTADPYVQVGENEYDSYVTELLQQGFCPDMKGYTLDITHFDLEDRCRLQKFLDVRGIVYSLARILRAVED